MSFGAAVALGLSVLSAGPSAADDGRGVLAAESVTGASWARPGRILRVGPQRRLTTPSAAAAVARDRDRIRIDAGLYRDCAVWTQNGLFIEGVGGRVRLHGPVCAGQAIWLIRGDRIAIRNIEFSGARAPAGNGAGIKFTGATLSLFDTVFHDNENGLLTGPGARSRIRVAASDFRRNGACNGPCAHGLYAGHVARLTVTGSTFLGQRIGHHIKSRAEFSDIRGNRIEDGPLGTASYAIDLPNAGAAEIIGNFLHKGPRSDNVRALVAIGAEGATNRAEGVRIRRNLFVSDNARLEAFVWNAGARGDVTLDGNRFEGPGVPLIEAGLGTR